MKLTQQQVDELRAWQHEKAPGGKLLIENEIGVVSNCGNDSKLGKGYFQDLPCD
jgi:hypothetical protein